jgi:hypothetical protein
MDYDIGDLVRAKNSTHNNGLYMFLGLVQKGQQHPVVEEAMMIMGNHETGWYTPVPALPEFIVGHKSRNNPAAEVSGYMVNTIIWNTDIFEKAKDSNDEPE